VSLWWTNPSTGNAGNNTRAEIVNWIENQDGKACHFHPKIVATVRHWRQELRRPPISIPNLSKPLLI
jgi:hypothetical protein